jgi:hypothetical protein
MAFGARGCEMVTYYLSDENLRSIGQKKEVFREKRLTSNFFLPPGNSRIWR